MKKNEIQLSKGAIKYLQNLNHSQNSIIVDFIFQIYECIPLSLCNLYRCSVFDDECFCDAFLLKYNEKQGRPRDSDIIKVSVISKIYFPNKEICMYICEEVKLLHRMIEFVKNFDALEKVSVKKIEKENSTNCTEKKIKNSNINKNTMKIKLTSSEKLIKNDKVDNFDSDVKILNKIISDEEEKNNILNDSFEEIEFLFESQLREDQQKLNKST